MLYFNSLPAHTFLGDSGAQLLGFLLASLGIAYTPPGLPQPSSWFVPILLLSIPIFDTSLVVFSRLRQRKAFYQAGLDHTYHRLVNLGWPPARAVLIFAAAVLTGLVILVWLTRKERL
jgi:UDP-GlcNAc:undecaprenyl-phosphate/decaprenyl-phosphate GlcNAc-1-phosphate transferase